MRWYVFIIITLFTYCFLRGQQNNNLELKKAEKLYHEGVEYRYKNRDSAYFFFEESYRIFETHENWLGCVYAINAVNDVSSFFYDLEKYKATIFMIDSIFESNPTYFDTIVISKTIRNSNFINKSDYYIKINDFEKARWNAIRLRQLIEEIPDSLRTIDDIKKMCIALEYEAGTYKREGKYAIAEGLYLKSLLIIKDKLYEDFALPTYRLLGDLYGDQKKFDKSNYYLRKKLTQEINKGNSSKNKVVHSCYTIAKNHIDRNKNDKNDKHFDSTLHYLSIARQQLFEKDPLEYEYFRLLGELEISVKEYDKALISVDSSIQLLSQDSIKLKSIELVTLHTLKAKILDQMKNYVLALGEYQTALKVLSKDFMPKNIEENPALETVSNKYEYLKVLKEKANTLKNAKDFIRSLNTVKLAISVMDALKPTFQYEEDKQFLIENFYPIFEIGLVSASKLHEQTGNASYIDDAFYISEKSKSAILLEAILNAQAYTYANLPSDLLEKEHQLKASIQYLNKEIDKDEENAELEDQLFEKEKAYRDHITEIENQSPEYFNLKYNDNVISLLQLQNTLDKNTLILSYFYGKEALYAIIISRNKTELKNISLKNGLEKKIKDFQKLITDPSSNITTINNTGNVLYKQILKPLISDIKFTNLIVIPDGILNYLPFESLSNGSRYMIEDKSISYANSATLLKHLNAKSYKNKDILAFAPSFSGRHTSLKSSENEVQNILDYFKGQLYKGVNATLKTFNLKSSSFGIVHLATHAIIDDENPEDSHLVFSSKEGIDSLLTRDIYMMNVNADLVTLSACQTDIGRLRKGEGMISLSRAFFYAGAASIVSTKWQVNDRSTSDIMGYFYKHLSEGQKKDEALRSAKTDFFKKYKDTGYIHPYWWSGIAVSGNTNPLITRLSRWLWAIPLLIVLGSFIIWIRRKRTTS